MSHLPRALLIHPSVQFMNPTTTLWPKLLQHVASVVPFGPGYVSDEELKRGISEFVIRRGPFDLVVMSEHTVTQETEVEPGSSALFFKKNYGIHPSRTHEFFRLKDRFIQDALGLGVPVIATFFEFDPFRVGQATADRVRSSPMYILGWGPEFVADLADLPDVEVESFGGRATNLWRGVLDAKDHKVISMPAFVVDAEFCDDKLLDRRATWAVPGTTYARRREARQILRSRSIPEAGRGLRVGVAAYDRLSGGRIGSSRFRSITQARFGSLLKSTKACYTCGSALRYPVRKYFEIPAAGALLVCDPVEGFEKLGFRDGVNAICAKPSDLPDLSIELLGDDLDRAQRIADAGRLLVAERHSMSARIGQLNEALSRVVDGSFEGSYWDSGEMRLRPSARQSAERRR